MKAFFGSIGRGVLQFVDHARGVGRLFREFAYWAVIAPFRGKRVRWHSTVHQMVLIGINSLPIVTMICFFVGLIMAMQSAYQLQKFGATIYVANLVAVAITRELGPLLTAIIVTGRSGSAIAAEIGTMKVSEEIDALRTMGFNPNWFLVVPRVLALLIVLPCLTIIADFAGVVGGFLIGLYNLKFSFIRFYLQTADALVLKDFITGLIKSGVFALIIAMIGCYQGFIVEGGAEGVGKSTTASVVTSIFLIVLADVFFTAVFYFAF